MPRAAARALNHSGRCESHICAVYQLWVNLPPQAKMVPPCVQLLLPDGSAAASAAEVMREGSTPVRRACVGEERQAGGAVRVRTVLLAARAGC